MNGNTCIRSFHGQGSPETARDPRGLAVKYYNKKGD